MKKSVRTATLLLVLIMALSLFSGTVFAKSKDLVDTSKIFKDVNKTAWYIDAVNYAYTNSIFNGTSYNTFEPNSSMNRAMFVTVLGRLSGYNPSNNVTTAFKDVPYGKWYTGYVKWAADGGIVKGITENTFEPLTSITREQMCTMLVRYANFENITIDRYSTKVIFADDNKIKEYAKESVYICQMSGLVNGMTPTTFEPAKTATRAQVAKILMGFSELYLTEEEATDNPTVPETPDNPTDPETPDNPTDPETPVDPDALAKIEKDLILNSTPNRHWMPAFDLDSTGFVKSGTKLSDLTGKTLIFFTSDNYPVWGYRNSKGEYVDEWDWFKELKSEIGINIKYTVKQHSASLESALQYMNAGRQLDIVYTDGSTFPASLAISRNLNSYIDSNAKMPGISKKLMSTVKWGKELRLISPVGEVDVLWYNKTLSDSLNMNDPHSTWKDGNWNWNSFKNYLTSAPDKVSGKDLTAFTHTSISLAHLFPSTTGYPLFHIENATVPTIINNWDNPASKEAWDFITSTCNSINFKNSVETSSSISPEYIGLYEGTTLMAGSVYSNIYRNYEYSKNIRLDWVPYPKKSSTEGKDVCQYLGYGMMLPKKTVKENNVPIALKFMELWASRFSESIFDGLKDYEYFKYSDKQISEFYDYTTENVTLALGMNNLSGVSNVYKFYNAFNGTGSYNAANEASKLSSQVSMHLINMLKYGQ